MPTIALEEYPSHYTQPSAEPTNATDGYIRIYYKISIRPSSCHQPVDIMSKWLNTSGTRKYVKLENSIRSFAPQAGQIANILKVQESMKRGDDLKIWSLSARKGLGAAGGAAFVVPKAGDAERRFEAPKLAMIVASPIIADYFVKNPESEEFFCQDPNFRTRAIEQIAFWLRVAITVTKLENIHLPKLRPGMSLADLKESLDLRVAMQLLGMSQHINHFVELYKATLEHPEDSALDSTKTPTIFRIPTTAEARTILDHAMLGARDEVVDALAYHMVVVKKKHGLDFGWELFLSDHKNFMLSQAMKMAEAVFVAKVKEQRKIKKHQRQQSKNAAENVKLPLTTTLYKNKGKPGTPKDSSRSPTNNLFELLGDMDRTENAQVTNTKMGTKGKEDIADADEEGWVLAKKR